MEEEEVEEKGKKRKKEKDTSGVVSDLIHCRGGQDVKGGRGWESRYQGRPSVARMQ